MGSGARGLHTRLHRSAARPALFAPHSAPFWDDPHISQQLLAAHLDPRSDAASRCPDTIDRSVAWLTSQLDLRSCGRVLDLGCGPGLYAERLAGLRAIRLAAATPASLDTPLADDSERTRGDLVADEPALTTMQSAGEHDELADQVEAALDDLPPREREVLRLRFGLGKTDGANLAEIGSHLGVTRERARQIEGQALRRLRADRRLRRALVDLQTA